jgi:hypothetical protein
VPAFERLVLRPARDLIGSVHGIDGRHDGAGGKVVGEHGIGPKGRDTSLR